MGALTPARRLFGSREHEHRPYFRAGLPASCVMPSWPFRLHPPDVPRPRFPTLPLSEDRFPAALRVEISPSGCRLIAHVRPYRVRHPTDWSLPVDCSPPRLAATQLSLGTGRRAYARRGLPPLCHDTLAGAHPCRAKRGHPCLPPRNPCVPLRSLRWSCLRALGCLCALAWCRCPTEG